MPDGGAREAPVVGRRLARRGYAADASALAQRLIGCAIVRTLDDGTRLAARIVETEAYLGEQDKAAHSYAGRRTARTEAMYARPGTSYVFFTYGMHHCFNVVCGAAEEPVAVLVRAAEPIEGHETMRRLRAATRGASARPLRDAELCRGPACLCRALAIDARQNMLDLVESRELWIAESGVGAGSFSLANTPRIGVDYAGEWADRPLRWAVIDHPSVSGPRRLRQA